MKRIDVLMDVIEVKQ